MSSKLSIGAVVGVVIVVALVLVANQNRGNDLQPTVTQAPQENANEGSNPAAGIVRQGSSAVFIADQLPGNVAVVSTVIFTDPGFVVIHRSESGAAGEVLGASELIASSQDMVEITLDKPMVDGEEYLAMLHVDNGNGQWDGAGVDSPLMFEGEIIMMNFMASSDASEPPAVAF